MVKLGQNSEFIDDMIFGWTILKYQILFWLCVCWNL